MKDPQLTLPFRERRRLHDRAYRAQQRDHSEVCGVVAADQSGRMALHFLENRSDRSRHFEIRLTDVGNVRRALPAIGQRFVGIFHSHVVGYARPGEADLAGAILSHHLLIYDVCGREARLWRVVKRLGQRTAREVAISIEPRPPTKR